MDRGRAKDFPWRHRLLVLIFGCIAIGLAYRVFELTVTHRPFLQQQGDARTLRTLSIPAYRGLIADRYGQPLAVSSTVESVWINPKEYQLDHPLTSELLALLKLSDKDMTHKVEQAGTREFSYVKRGITPALAEQVRQLGLPGVYLQPEFKRYYPEGEVAAQVLGFTNIDDQGQEGIELAYNHWLSGKPGKQQVVKDRKGQIISDVAVLQEASAGKNITLTIDRRIQHVAYQQLKKTVRQHNAVSGSLVVLHAKTGEILAMANFPSFNPNASRQALDSRHRNRAVTDLFEPGSVTKAFTVASALDSGRFTMDSRINTSPSWLTLDGYIVRDIRDYGELDLVGILQHSSNVGVTKMVLESPAVQLYDTLQRVGFGRLTASDFPGEAVGVVNLPHQKRPFELATLAFGYGISVTLLQLTQAYLVFANEGGLPEVTLIARQQAPELRQVLPKEVANNMLTMLEAVVEQGTASRAKVPGYRVAGKTGTARIAAKTGGYEKDKHVATFVGIAPVNDPQLVMGVVIHQPRAGQYYGGLVAAPLFSEVMAGSLRILGVEPTA